MIPMHYLDRFLLHRQRLSFFMFSFFHVLSIGYPGLTLLIHICSFHSFTLVIFAIHIHSHLLTCYHCTRSMTTYVPIQCNSTSIVLCHISEDTFPLYNVDLALYKSANLSVASTNSLAVPVSLAECPASGTM